ncbi:MAG: hypothetical protein KDA89_23985, partial [Planctomycetaceae bacterium]|nr:hypothetical protein [Planctomycetaceae bacterium]
MIEIQPDDNPYRAPGLIEDPKSAPAESGRNVLTWTRAMILLQSASILICLPIAWIEIESILVSGPVVSLSGFVSAFFSRRCGNRAGWWFGLSGFGITVSCFLLINIYQWGPADARVPVIRVLNVYTLV